MIPAIIGAAAWAVPLILKYGPGLAQYLGGPKAGDIASKGADLIHAVTGTTDPVMAERVLADPAKNTDIRLQLAQLQSDAEAAKRRDELEEFKASLADVQSARAQTVALAQAGSRMSWAAPVISVFIIACFMLCIVLLLFVNKSWDTFTTSLLQTLFGALVLAFGQVTNYWLGASASGRRAQEANQALAQQATVAANQTVAAAAQVAKATTPPVVVVPPVATPTVPAATPATGDVSNEWEQGPYGGVRFKLTSDGVLVEGETQPARTVGEPVTVRRIWKDFGPYIQQSCAANGVPLELVVATIATESRGKVDALLREPDGRQSLGLMQVLTGTAEDMMGRPVTAQELTMPEIGIEAGVRYIKFQYKVTKYMPPWVACAYNAGGLYPPRPQDNNRWNLRSTGNHADRLVLYFNDACFVAKQDGWSH